MTSEQGKKRMAELSASLHKHNHLYYVLSQPEISDYDFDMMLKELEQLEEQFPEHAVRKLSNEKGGGRYYQKL